MNRRFCALILVLALLCSACGARKANEQTDTPPEGQYSVYFLADPDQPEENGSALAWEFRTPSEGIETVGGLLQLLLAGPISPSLRSPFPQGTTLRTWRWEDGLLTVDLSEAYGGLSGVDLTLADACITLTLCQLDGVERIYLTVEGRPRPFRNQVLEPEQFLLKL